MGEITGIEWTDKTHNYWYGCKKVSQGCRHCYAEREMTKFGRSFQTITRAKGFDKPLSWKEPAKVFVNSWSDYFIEEADEWRAEAWDIIRQTPHLTYQILTKRPELVPDRLPEDWGKGYPNVWLGVSVEDQENADRRIPLLFKIPAIVRFLSCEPLLGALDLAAYLLAGWHKWEPKLHWVICGGESGPNYRPMKLEWAQNLRDQCVNCNAPFFFKQCGGWPDKRGDLDKIPTDLRIREYPYVYAAEAK